MSSTVRAKNSQANDIAFEDDETSEFEESQTGGVKDDDDSAPTSDVDEINDISDKTEGDDSNGEANVEAQERVKENA